MKNKAIRYTALVSLISWMCVIFWFSAQHAEASHEMSNGVLEDIISVFWPRYNNLSDFALQDIAITFILPIRKLAHIFEFFLLGILSFVFLSTFTGALKAHRSVLSFLFGLIYSITDEVHQIFVPGRACQFSDVLIDTIGTFIAIMICVMLSRLWRRKRIEK